ncbi:MAG TPA: helical backbone metal receptor [Candidatus Thermoplasmatota archaeon]|nr:helical backbone metal receptor [Candidatus Thermoplasmatota archaeon]
MRVVSLVPSWSETLWEWGLREGELIGVTNFCVRPRAMFESVERVGGTKDPRVARIVELAPDLVVVNVEENRKPDVDALLDAGLKLHVTDVRTVEAAAREVRALGGAVGRPTEGEALAVRIEDAHAEARRARFERKLRAFVPIWKKPWMTLNGDTYASALLAACGFANVAAGLGERYATVEEPEIRALAAEVALLPTEPYPFGEKHRGDLEVAGIPRARCVVVDGQALTWYGWRTPEGVAELARVRSGVGR